MISSVFGLDRIETLELLGHQYNFIERDAMRMGHEAIKAFAESEWHIRRDLRWKWCWERKLIRKKM